MKILMKKNATLACLIVGRGKGVVIIIQWRSHYEHITTSAMSPFNQSNCRILSDNDVVKQLCGTMCNSLCLVQRSCTWLNRYINLKT